MNKEQKNATIRLIITVFQVLYGFIPMITGMIGLIAILVVQNRLKYVNSAVEIDISAFQSLILIFSICTVVGLIITFVLSKLKAKYTYKIIKPLQMTKPVNEVKTYDQTQSVIYIECSRCGTSIQKPLDEKVVYCPTCNKKIRVH